MGEVLCATGLASRVRVPGLVFGVLALVLGWLVEVAPAVRALAWATQEISQVVEDVGLTLQGLT